MENPNEEVNTEPVVLEPKKQILFPQVKVFTSSGKYEEERCMLIDVINNSGILDKYYPVNDNNTNPIVLIYNNLHNPNYGIFRHYETPISSRKSRALFISFKAKARAKYAANKTLIFVNITA